MVVRTFAVARSSVVVTTEFVAASQAALHSVKRKMVFLRDNNDCWNIPFIASVFECSVFFGHSSEDVSCDIGCDGEDDVAASLVCFPYTCGRCCCNSNSIINS